MKTAKEMFEELGYKVRGEFVHLTYGKIVGFFDGTFNSAYVIYIQFFEDKKSFYKWYSVKVQQANLKHDEICITYDEYKAITKQMEELGWLDE